MIHGWDFDCILIGAGQAGLSASLFLARYRRKLLTLHNNKPRNSYSQGIHGLLGHLNIPPAQLLARGSEEVLSHGGTIIEGTASTIEKLSGGVFKVTTEQPESRTFLTRVLLATGLRELTPDCAGFREYSC